MPDICDLILDDHEQFRRRFAELDDRRREDGSPESLGDLWQPLADMLERHASAEEELFYPTLLARGRRAVDETDDAISDHNSIRTAVGAAQRVAAGSDQWWAAVLDARANNSDHMAEEEREAIPDFRVHVEPSQREDLGVRWLRFSQQHAGASGLSGDTKDVEGYIEDHR